MLEATLSEQAVIEVYGRIARFYDLWANLTEARARSVAIEKSGLHDGQTVLEVAVGTGILFERIVAANPNGKNIGIDLTKEMLARASARLAKSGALNYELKIGNALALDQADAQVDLLFNCYMLDLLSFKKIEIALDEFRRVLKTGGRLVLVNMTEGESALTRAFEALYKLSPRLMGGCRGLLMEETVVGHGFRIESRDHVVQMLFPSEVIVAVKI